MEYKHVEIKGAHQVNSKPPPLPPETSEFNSIREWLLNMCEIGGSEGTIDTFHFRLVDPSSDKQYTLWFYGSNASDLTVQDNVSDERFPLHISTTVSEFNEKIYYPLNHGEISNLSREQVHEKIISELRSFTATDIFKKSHFAKAKLIIADFTGELIWKQSESVI